MKNSRFFCWCLGASLAVSLNPMLSFAQTTGSTATGSSTGSTGAAMGGSGNTGGTTNSGNSNNTNSATQQIGVQSITTGAGSATSIPSNSNPFVQTYVDPMSVGVASKFTQFGVAAKPSGTFGKGIYVSSTSTTPNRGGGGATQGSTANQQGNGFTTLGTPRTPSYSTVMDPDLLLAPMASPQMQSNLRAALQRSSYLSNQKNIEIVVNGSTVELRGVVATEKERRAAEGIVGTSPGVFDVINQLQIQAN